MVSTAALISALQGQFSAARQGQGGGSTAGLPGLLASGNGEGGNAINALASGGISAGGVPGTATTGASVGNALLGGGGAGDPLSQQVLQSNPGLFGNNREPNNPSGASLGEFDNLQGGDVNILKSMLSGNPLLMLAMIGNAIAGEGRIPSNPGDLGAFGDSAIGRAESEGRTLGGALGGSLISGPLGTGGGTVGNIRSGHVPSDRPDRQGPGAGPSRGAPGAGNRGR